jgi:hypothetical protein
MDTLIIYLTFNLFVFIFLFYESWIGTSDSNLLLFPDLVRGGSFWQKIGRVIMFIICFLPTIVLWYLWLGLVCLWFFWVTRGK